MIKYILDNYYNRFEEVKKENNLLDYTDLELYTLRLLYNKRKDYSIEEKKEIEKLFHKTILQRPYFSGYRLLFSTLSALFRTSAGQTF